MRLVKMFFVGMLATSLSAKAAPPDDDGKLVKKDTTIDKYGFKNLFVNATYSAEKPYENQIQPQAWGFIQDYIRRQGKELNAMKDWGQPYFAMIDAILVQYGLPRELKYLAVIESHLKTHLVSWVGAVGPWQFMPETGRQMGLRVDRFEDERTNYYKSTHAAAKYLKQLYAQTGDWLLVIASYNCGPGRVFSAIKRSGSRNFWDLQNYLPLESRNHVKKFIGTHYIFEGKGGFTTTSVDDWNQEQMDLMNNAIANKLQLTKEEVETSSTVLIVGKFNSMVIAKDLVMDVNVFNKYNPDFDKQVATGKEYELRLPTDKMELFKATKNQIMIESMQAMMNSVEEKIETFPEVKPKVKEKKKRKR
jgi:membrane-bound lytic murein transglycosylase D